MFSPPTTEEGADHLGIKTVIGGNSIDTTSTAAISSLTPQTLTDLQSYPTSSQMIVNSLTGLVFRFTLTDTITKNDIFYLDFPIGTTINYLTSISTFSLTNISFDSATGRMQFYQGAQSQTLNSGDIANITFLTYQASPSTKPINNI